jgi:large subunit ribosomal protein L18
MAANKEVRRKGRVRRTLKRVAYGRPRLSVFRSSQHIYAQVIDDVKGETLAAASSLEKDVRAGGKTGASASPSARRKKA